MDDGDDNTLYGPGKARFSRINSSKSDSRRVTGFVLSSSAEDDVWDDTGLALGGDLDPIETITAKETGARPSKVKRMILILSAVFFSLTLSGVVFGWPAVVIMMQEQNVYNYKCSANETIPCQEQVDQFNLIFTIASTGFAISVLPMGAILDRFGPKISSLIGSALVLGGSLMFAFSDPPNIDMFIPGYLLIAMGGPPVVFSFMHISNLFPENKGTIITMLNVALDASSLIFVILGALYDGIPALRSYKVCFGFACWFCLFFSFQNQAVFLLYSVFPLLSFVVSLFLWPSSPFEPEVVEEYSELALPTAVVPEKPFKVTTSFWFFSERNNDLIGNRCK
jgi:MFS family permease